MNSILVDTGKIGIYFIEKSEREKPLRIIYERVSSIIVEIHQKKPFSKRGN
jgi:hypothetical protein